MLKAPFPWFGGKSMVANIVWERFGNVSNYVEPFFGSGAVLLARPSSHLPTTETINDKDGFVANAWRAILHDPEKTAHLADWPVNGNDLHARHAWLTEQRESLTSMLEGDPEFYDAKIAGWWLWGIACWIGSGFCSGAGPWHRQQQLDGSWQLVHLGSDGQGVNRKRVHLGDDGLGVNRKRVHLGDGLTKWFCSLSSRLARVRVCCGDWSRVVTPTVIRTTDSFKDNHVTGVFLDPPYSAEAGRDADIYSVEDLSIAHNVRAWAIENAPDKRIRIALCGYEGEYAMPDSWECVPWKTGGGYSNQGNAKGKENSARERIWFSPHCLAAKQSTLF